ncbi:hypothetical protein [Actinomycetospora sp. TBRC 11914]|uniref:hypothetical protein n=1 Tax=Actinomycetospora sp. TBRC 11914 TaxID=2729387 RepID=UPI00145E0999|nr:hypothetical protein [Actinomycetospora sp. TBRC 11914]NMO88687.1 hypothetical protein [Actinomycetospora sp. TBRC 11914]
MDTARMTVGAPGRPLDRWWSLLFAVSGVALLPWIVLLYLFQPAVAAVGNLALAATGALAVLAVGLLVSAALTLARSRYLAMISTATATLALCAGFFHVVTGTADNPRAAAFATVVVVGPVAVLGILVARHGARPRRRGTDRLIAVLFVLGAVATVLAWVRAASMGFDAQYAHHLKIAWIALDVAEAGALLLTAAALWQHPARVPAAAAVTGTLLCSDVWFNVVGATGEARTNAIQMAFVSIPLAVAALWVGVREIRQARQAE